jgi:hypothetical protein
MSPESWSAWAAWIALAGGTLSGFGAWKAYRLAKKHDDLLSGDQEIVAGRLQKPELAHFDHRKCVLWTHLVNRSSRRVVVHDVRAFGPRGEPIEITWSGRISEVGNVEAPSGVLAVEAQTEIYLRRNSGEAFPAGTIIKLAHGFPGSPLVLKYAVVDWDDWAAS